MTKFSSGPWAAKFSFDSAGEGWTDIIDSQDGIVGLVNRDRPDDARLIAAGPEMYALLRSDHPLWGTEEWEVARRALLARIDGE